MPILTRVSPAERILLKAPLRIVSIGGGTGLSTLLSGLKKHARGTQDDTEGGLPAVDIAAVVTVTDDGGSSGRLRRDFDILPPGDIRNCMTALSEDEHLLSRLFQYRFDGGRGLKGHSFGNLFLTALRHYQERSLQTCQQQSEQGSAKSALRERLLSAARMASGIDAQRGCFQVNCIIEIAPHDPEVAELVKKHSNRVATQLAGLIRRGQQNGEFRTDPEASILAKYVISSIYGLSVAGKAGMSAREIERIVEVIISSLER